MGELLSTYPQIVRGMYTKKKKNKKKKNLKTFFC